MSPQHQLYCFACVALLNTVICDKRMFAAALLQLPCICKIVTTQVRRVVNVTSCGLSSTGLLVGWTTE